MTNEQISMLVLKNQEGEYELAPVATPEQGQAIASRAAGTVQVTDGADVTGHFLFAYLFVRHRNDDLGPLLQQTADWINAQQGK
jgi:hypothetical protein